MKGEIGMTKQGEDGYKVLMMDNSLRPPLPKVIEIYDSAEKVRKVAGDLRRNLIVWKSVSRLTFGTGKNNCTKS